MIHKYFFYDLPDNYDVFSSDMDVNLLDETEQLLHIALSYLTFFLN